MNNNPITQNGSRKEREKKAREQDILQAARKLFLVKGYHETTLEEIAHHAEFGKGTIYNYFSSKEELFFAIIDQINDEMLQLAKTAFQVPSESSREMFTRYALLVMTYSHDNSDLLQLIMREIHNLNSEQRHAKFHKVTSHMQGIWKILSKPLQKELMSDHIRPFDPFALAVLFDGMLRFYCTNRYGPFRSLKQVEIGQAADMIVTVFFDGISESK